MGGGQGCSGEIPGFGNGDPGAVEAVDCSGVRSETSDDSGQADDKSQGTCSMKNRKTAADLRTKTHQVRERELETLQESIELQT
jgi:hypothetical protein